jgi:hypothetical protein
MDQSSHVKSKNRKYQPIRRRKTLKRINDLLTDTKQKLFEAEIIKDNESIKCLNEKKNRLVLIQTNLERKQYVVTYYNKLKISRMKKHNDLLLQHKKNRPYKYKYQLLTDFLKEKKPHNGIGFLKKGKYYKCLREFNKYYASLKKTYDEKHKNKIQSNLKTVSESIKSNRSNRSKKVCKHGPKSFDSLNFTVGSENENSIPITLHNISRRKNHWSDANLVIMMIEQIICGNLPVLSFDSKKDDVRIRCMSKKLSMSNENCDKTISMMDLFKRLDHVISLKSEVGVLKNKFKNFITIMKRKEYMKKNNCIDCIFCIDPTGTDGLGYLLSDHSFKYSDFLFRMNINDVRKCRTCNKIWCTNCQVEFNCTSSSTDKISHDGINCTMFKKLQESILSNDEILFYQGGKFIKCPNCNVPIEKIDACNHMKCIQCFTDFCYVCGKDISHGQIYSHFGSHGCRQY